MQVEHTLAMKLTRQFTAEETAAIQAGLTSIPGVLSVSAGANYTTRGQGYNAGIVVRLASKEAEAAYQTHAEHVRVRDEIIKPLFSAPPIVLDWECKPSEGLLDSKPVLLALGLGVGIAIGQVARSLFK